MLLLAAGVGAFFLVGRRADPPRVLSRAEKDRYLADGKAVARDVMLQPHPPSGPAVDYLVLAHMEPGSPLEAGGFRVGDRILKLNGTPIGTLERALNLAAELRRADAVEVELLRDGRPLTFHFHFR